MRNAFIGVVVVAFLIIFTAGCVNTEQKMKEASAMENTGNFREAANMYSALALRLAPEMKLPEAHKGKTTQPAIWQSDIEKYIAWLTEQEPARDNRLRSALDGLERSVQHFEQDNTGRRRSTTTLDTLPDFSAQWDKAFNPPPPRTIDWHGITKQAYDKKFSIVRFSAPKSYSYDVNVICRKNARRVSFSIYPESEIFVPLPPAEYTIITRSSVEFQNGRQRWTSEYSALSVSVSDTVSLIEKELRTRVIKRDN